MKPQRRKDVTSGSRLRGSVLGKICVWLVWVCVLFAPSVVWAEDVPPTDEEYEAADAAFTKGYQAYSEGKYADALVAWRQAYEFVPAAVFLFNAAQAAQKNGKLEQALGLANKAQEAKALPLTAEERSKNEALIESIQADIAQKEAQRLAREAARPPTQKTWIGVAVGGVGAGLIITSLIMGSSVSQDMELLEQEQDREAYDELRSSVEGRQLWGQVLLYTGSAAVLGGVGLVLWDFMGSSEDAAAIGVVPLPGGAHATLTWEF